MDRLAGIERSTHIKPGRYLSPRQLGEEHMPHENGGIGVGERIKRCEEDITTMKTRIRALELHWAYATGIICAVMVALKYWL